MLRAHEPRSWAAWLAHAALCLCSVLSPRATLAEATALAPRVRLSWVREDEASSCPDARFVQDAVRTRLGRDPFSDSAELAAEIVVTRAGSGFVARIRVRDAAGNLRGERTLSSEESCPTLAEGVALALALYIDPDAALAPASRATSPAPAPAPTARAAVPTAPASTTALAEPAEPRTRGALAAGVAFAYGLLPGLAPGAQLHAELTLARRMHPFLSGVFFPEQRTAGGDFAFGLSVGGLGTCVDAVLTRRVALAPCVSLVAGELHSVVFTLQPTHPGGQFWMAATALLRLRVSLLPALFLEFGAGAWLPFFRDSFRVTGHARTAFRESPAVALGQLQLGTSFR